MDGHEDIAATRGERINAGISSADSNFVAGLKLQNHRTDEIGKMNPHTEGVVLKQHASKRTVSAISVAAASVLIALFMPSILPTLAIGVMGFRVTPGGILALAVLVGGLYLARRIYKNAD